MKITVSTISIPGIEKFRYVFGLIPCGKILDDKEIKTLVKYKVKPIGIRTITPVKNHPEKNGKHWPER